MADDEKDLEKKGKEGEKELEEKVGDEEMIKLTPSQYAALLDRMSELESPRSSGRRVVDDEPGDLDSLIEEGTKKGKGEEKPPLSPEDIDGLSNSQLVQLLTGELNQYMMPVLTRIEKMRVETELRDTRKEHEDFEDYSDEVYKLTVRDPQLSIEDAYLLAKGRKEKAKPKEGDKEKDKEKDKKGKLFNLPPRPVFGERPGPSHNVAKTTPKTLMEATERAYEEVFEKKTKK